MTNWVDRHKPSLLVFSQADYYRLPIPNVSPTTPFSAAQWGHGLDALFRGFRVRGMRMVLLGSTPILAQRGPVCLAQHPTEVQVCSSPARLAVPRLAQVDQQVAKADHVLYIDTVPWFCSATCTPIIGSYEVYDATGTHITGVWAKYLQNAVAEALDLSKHP